jgi:hypothetical protein
MMGLCTHLLPLQLVSPYPKWGGGKAEGRGKREEGKGEKEKKEEKIPM